MALGLRAHRLRLDSLLPQARLLPAPAGSLAFNGPPDVRAAPPVVPEDERRRSGPSGKDGEHPRPWRGNPDAHAVADDSDGREGCPQRGRSHLDATPRDSSYYFVKHHLGAVFVPSGASAKSTYSGTFTAGQPAYPTLAECVITSRRSLSTPPTNQSSQHLGRGGSWRSVRLP